MKIITKFQIYRQLIIFIHYLYGGDHLQSLTKLKLHCQPDITEIPESDNLQELFIRDCNIQTMGLSKKKYV